MCIGCARMLFSTPKRLRFFSKRTSMITVSSPSPSSTRTKLTCASSSTRVRQMWNAEWELNSSHPWSRLTTMKNLMICSTSLTTSHLSMRELIVLEAWTQLAPTAQMRQNSGYWTKTSGKHTWISWFKWSSRGNGVLTIDSCLSIICSCRKESPKQWKSSKRSGMRILMIHMVMLIFSTTISRRIWTSSYAERLAHLSLKMQEVLLASTLTTLSFTGEFSSRKFKNSLKKLMNPTNQQKNAKRGMSSLITLKTLKTKESASRWKWSLKWTSLLITNQRQSWSIISMSAKWRSTITLSTWKYCSLRLLSSALMLKILALSSHSYLRRLHLIQTRQPLSSLFHQTSLQET